MAIPFNFDFEQFQQVTPLNGETIWAYILDRNAQRIGVKRRKPALENLERIFVATFRLANDVGFRAMSLRDLCRETGLSMGGLYGYIASKDQLAEIIEDVVHHAIQDLPSLFSDIAAPLDRLEALIRASIYLSEILQPWFYFVYMDSRVLQAEQRSMAKHSELRMQELIAATIQEIRPRPAGEATQLADHCLALFQDWYVKRWKYRAGKVNVDDFATSTVRMVRTCLGGK
ncbi:TetR/AcrR family transcriptional regulator [Janthinobacterium agaricidamnosum]|uniref:Bacterial regulatory s, tetR family protein n=1 Tax=Janthinobacterium agaricidamnosum NBRC 102515 = DSM 9628 TaxID=1349767 RepID=W0V611_9BURK|nr:TetR family transcriptional regulator [Janthinobacterium agaricidamnosum]CDG82793.1 bacterial regulatory s, tetR family protein [Janthinobacterium agaricidamnosum NBRC 102515 = DSM 9628]